MVNVSTPEDADGAITDETIPTLQLIGAGSILPKASILNTEVDSTSVIRAAIDVLATRDGPAKVGAIGIARRKTLQRKAQSSAAREG